MKNEWKNCFRIGLTIFLTFLAIHYWDSLTGLLKVLFDAAKALLCGCVIAYVLNILMSFYESHYFPNNQNRIVQKSRRAVCLTAAIVSLVAVIVLIVGLVLPELAGCVRILVSEVPAVIENGVRWLEDSGVLAAVMSEEAAASLAAVNWQEKITQMFQVLVQGVGDFAQVAVGAVSATFSGITTFVIGLIFAIYILSGKEVLGTQIGNFMNHYLKESWNKKIRYVTGIFHDCFHKFIVGQCIEAVVLGVLCILGMTVLRFPYAIMTGTLIGFSALIPVAGAYIGAGIGAFMIMTVSPIKAAAFLLFIVILQQLEGNLIYPKVVGSSIGLPGIWVLAAVTVGGGVFGIPGMLIGVPVTAACYQLIKKDMTKSIISTENLSE